MEHTLGSPILASIQSHIELLPDEHLILTKRQHWSLLLKPIVDMGLFVVLTSGVISLLGIFFSFPFIFYILSFIILTAFILTYSIKTGIEWYCHVYFITNRKILELGYRLFVTEIMNTIFLDQVRCTEIDVQVKGPIHALLNRGDIVITFDRHTHEDEFILADVDNPHVIGLMLETMMQTVRTNVPDKTVFSPLHHNNQETKNLWNVLEELS